MPYHGTHIQGAGIGRVQGLRCNFSGLMILASTAVQASRREAHVTKTKLRVSFVFVDGVRVITKPWPTQPQPSPEPSSQPIVHLANWLL